MYLLIFILFHLISQVRLHTEKHIGIIHYEVKYMSK